ncbi:uncharacterized protein LOC106376968 [Brassica napus]|uniref:uncharacterized protein LOC106303778 n=1 Tax=Brassica oleracea var. oleracea TaxID=109376 RepID=UPI0006A72B5F|nr:PREDICTED: uncharacterized protein LOC106303778 [Brassica oleracea var. oleracea]XP_013672566.1 uncharacterized protein LOC106376968 [Brassica napus]
MPDWGPVFVAVALFVLLTPGVLIQIPGKNRVVEFGTFQTSGLSVIVHTLIYFTLVCILLLAIQIHICYFYTTTMTDWAPVIVGVILFVILSPGLLFSLPGNNRAVDFGNLKTNGKAIAVHTLIFFAIYSILIIAVNLHIYTG